ncbi:hypothetical protein DIPPA_27924 [Diplonema papillatum]|nr:hypothetical protein DIPPA_27924 [Diplonema papillatum]
MVNFECKVEDVDLDDEPLDWEFHPLAFSIGNHKKKYFVGALVGNTCLCAGFFAAQYLVAWAIMSIWSISWGTAVFFARAPGLVAIPLMALLTGTALSSFNLALYPHSAGTLPSIVGAVGVAVCILFPLILWNCLFSLPQFKAATVPDPKLALHEEGSSFLTKDTPSGSSHHYESPDVFSSSWTKSAYIFAFGRRVWVRHSDAPPFWVEQWGMFFEGFKQGFHWFSLVEIVEILCISLLSVWRPVEFAPCMSRNLLLTVVVSGYFGSIVYYRPHNAPLDLWVSVLTSGTTMLAIILISVSIALRGNPAWLVEALTTTSAVLLLISALFTLGKGVYDITLYFVDLRIGRRKDARKLDKAYNRTSPQVRGVNAQELSLWESTDDETDSEQVTARSQRVAASPSVFAHGTPDEKLCLRDTPTALSNRQNSVEARTADHRARARSIASSTLCSPLRPPHQKASYSSKSSSPALFHSPDEFPIDFGVAPYFLQQPPPTRPRRMSSLVTLAPSRSFPEHLLLAPAGRSPRLLPKPNSRATVSLQT